MKNRPIPKESFLISTSYFFRAMKIELENLIDKFGDILTKSPSEEMNLSTDNNLKVTTF